MFFEIIPWIGSGKFLKSTIESGFGVKTNIERHAEHGFYLFPILKLLKKGINSLFIYILTECLVKAFIEYSG